MSDEGSKKDTGRSSKRQIETLAEHKDDDAAGGNLFKRVKQSDCECMAEDFVCPISHNLPIDPVIASDVSKLNLYGALLQLNLGAIANLTMQSTVLASLEQL